MARILTVVAQILCTELAVTLTKCSHRRVDVNTGVTFAVVAAVFRSAHVLTTVRDASETKRADILGITNIHGHGDKFFDRVQSHVVVGHNEIARIGDL
uniref:Uncharacterized protein n=1 Tax=Arion vulgaris TaxID=1028688 RepID=A0A0B6Z7F6_9EUPU